MSVELQQDRIYCLYKYAKMMPVTQTPRYSDKELLLWRNVENPSFGHEPG
jgi:hypothetical protein